MGEKQRRETPTERPALASSLRNLNPACLKDAWPCVGESAERIGGGRRAGITQGGISLCRSFSACRRWLRRAGGPATRGGTFGFYQDRTTWSAGRKGRLLLAVVHLLRVVVLLVVVQLCSAPQKRDHGHHERNHDGRQHHHTGVPRIDEDRAGGAERDDAYPQVDQ